MSDIALAWSNAILRADIAVAKGDIALDQGLRTAVIVSLFTDRPALPGDKIPYGAKPRQWWGYAFLGFVFGSRLWLLKRTVITPAVRVLMQDYAREALQWMIDDGVAGSIDVVATQTGVNAVNLSITINQQGGSAKFDLPWANELQVAA